MLQSREPLPDIGSVQIHSRCFLLPQGLKGCCDKVVGVGAGRNGLGAVSLHRHGRFRTRESNGLQYCDRRAPQTVEGRVETTTTPISEVMEVSTLEVCCVV